MPEDRWIFGAAHGDSARRWRADTSPTAVGERDLRIRGELLAEETRRHRLQTLRLARLTAWFAAGCPTPPRPDTCRCLACGASYARETPGASWVFCASCRGGAP